MNASQPLFTRKSIAKIIIPLALQGLLSVAIGMIDSMMVSVKSETAFAGVSLVNSLDVLLITLFGSLTAGGSVVLAQLYGKGELDRTRAAAKQLLYVTTFFATLISAVVLLLRVPLLHLLFGQAEASVMQSALDYFFFLALSFPFLAIEYSIAVIFRIQGDSMTALKISIFMNLLNITGNAVLIYGFDLDAAGAAIATLIARICAATVLLFFVVSPKRHTVYIQSILKYRPDLVIIKSILRIAIPNGIENSMFQFGRLLTSSLVSTLGTASISANAAAISLANLQYTAGSAVQNTSVAVVGRCVGAGEKEQARHYTASLLGVGYALVIGVNVILSVFSSPLLGLYGLSEESFAIARILLLGHCVVSSLIWPAAFCLPPSFRAASDVKFSMFASIFSMWVFRVALAYFLAPASLSVFGLFTIPCLGMGIYGVWIAMSADWIFRTILFVWRFFSGRWLTKYKAF